MNLRLTPERLHKLKHIGLRAGFGLVVFVVAFYLSFPYDRVKEQIVAVATLRDLDVEIASAGPALGFGISFDEIDVATRPPDGKPTRVRIEEATVRVSPLARLFGQDEISVSAEALGGEIEIDWEGSKTRRRVQVRGQDIAMASVPGIKEAINLPLAGKLGLDLDLRTVANRMGETSGSVGWTCAACAIGDGKAKLKVAGNPLLAEGLGLPRVRLGDFTGKVVFDKGVGKLQGVRARSPDGELSIEGEIRLADPMPLTTVDLYVRFKLSEALLKSADKLQLLLQIAESMGKGPDGYYGLRLTGSLGRLNPPQWSKTSPFGSVGGGPRPRSPSLTPSLDRTAPPPPAEPPALPPETVGTPPTP